jgi:hypothetical protein
MHHRAVRLARALRTQGRMTRSASALLACTLLWAGCTASTEDNSVEVTDSSADDAAKEDSANSLTSKQASQVLLLIDDACGDAWCEGDYEWAFKKMSCHFDLGTCTMTAMLTMPASGSTPAASYWRSCKMRGIRSFKSMVHTYANGFQALTDTMFTKVDACATKMEDSIPAT